tara:strand:+ start:226 stop:1044 length:819 start_codon:yes stop_codon:yes gene_type:complete
MAVTSIEKTDTLEQMRVKINSLAANDFGDIATLDNSLSATSVIGAVNEINAVVTAAQGFIIEDDASATQAVGSGQTIKFASTSNQITATVSSPDTVTMSFGSQVTVPSALTVPGVFNAGTLRIENNQLSSSDSTVVNINDALQVSSTITAGSTATFGVTSINPSGNNNIESSSGFTVFGSTLVLAQNKFIAFEGSADDANETTLNVVNPTADRTILLPNEDGTVITTGSTNVVTLAHMADDSVGSAELNNLQTLIIYNSAGTAVKTLYAAGT